MAPAVGRPVLQRQDRHRRRGWCSSAATTAGSPRSTSRTARSTWEFQTGGGVDAPASTFEEGQRQAVRHRTRGWHRPRRRLALSDGVWLLSLDGTIGVLYRAVTLIDSLSGFRVPPGCCSGCISRREPRSGFRTPSKDKGKQIYATTCVVCHFDTEKGSTHGGAPARRRKLTRENLVITVLINGRNDMPAFGSATDAGCPCRTSPLTCCRPTQPTTTPRILLVEVRPVRLPRVRLRQKPVRNVSQLVGRPSSPTK